MQLKNKFLPLLFFAVFASSQAANWVKVYDNGSEQGYIDVDSRTTVRGRERVWSKWTFSDKQKRSHTTDFQSYVKLRFYDCSGRSWQTKRVSAYSGPNLSGNIVYVAEYPSQNQEENDILPSGNISDIQNTFLKVICRTGHSMT